MKYFLTMGVIGFAVAAAVYWYEGSFQHYRAPGYVPNQCLSRIQSGEACIQWDITNEERQILMGDNVFDASGYVRNRGRDEYLSLLDTAENEAKRVAQKPREGDQKVTDEALRCMPHGSKLVGAIPEQPGIWSAVYSVDNGKRRLLLGRSDFWAYGGQSGKFGLTLKFSVHKNPASLMLSWGRRDGPALWDVGWVRDGVSFRVTVEDSVKNDQPVHYQPGQLIQLAEAIDTICHWPRGELPNEGISQPFDVPSLEGPPA
ncbi:hypothetical protein ACTHR6_25555 [Ralstonia holmesii]|uniref:Tle cognate immunity protein 4 C-terminal domain-containing protein n=1 Tax=Ralstonia holmesii TaxID=3058602 RepID=A0ABC8QJ50_9RALS|nr:MULTISPECIES: hypothetical protein [Ralstonia]CAJ0704175.1 hypothetical protein R11007_04261 [Ralstonia sp. LMG 32967]CAJ0806970.1 hypothetical protein LMG18096_04883 [Ralstonia sp. LMG 32967]CAJ0821496.1 hypothetical protein LMG18093_04721 [Ralstonia sp. LMG 32967]